MIFLYKECIMKILVTGGAGFIGSHLVEKLVSDGNDVYSLDNYFTGKKENHVPGVIYIEGETETFKFSDYTIPDIVFHLGEYSRVEQSYSDIDLVLDYNIKGTLNIIRECSFYDCKLIYAGSSSKFGTYLNSSISPYTWSKNINIDLIKQYHGWFGLSYAITYFYNVYGPREIDTGKYATVVGKFLQKKKLNQSVGISFPGNQRRNFTHISDIVDGLIVVGLSGINEEFGIGSDESYSIIELAELIGLDYSIGDEKMGNRMDAQLITEKTKALGWKSKHRLKDYIDSIIP